MRLYKYFFLIFLLNYSFSLFSQTKISGTVYDAGLKSAIPGANIKVARKAVGTTTDFDGKFELLVTENLPFIIEVSSLGYKTEKVEITTNNQVLKIFLKENATDLDEVVVSASRTPERVMESPVTIERFDSRAIKRTSAPSFYDGLENLKGIDINTSSLTFKSVNTRGFATFGNERFVQLVDGMDNASPALNFALGNLLGMSELDIKTVEILPGAASALYGANAFNGIMLMESKNPFDDGGISFMFKTGFTKQEAAGSNPFYDTSIRMAYAFNNKLAGKATFSYFNGEEWHATDYRNTNGAGDKIINGQRGNTVNYDGLNVYGDVVSANINDIAKLLEKTINPKTGATYIPTGASALVPNTLVSRTGYKEVDLVDYKALSVKFGGSLHYRPFGNDRLEIIWNTKYGTGNTIYHGQNRYNIKNFFMEQHKLEFKGKNFFVRGYYTGEDAGDSYDTRFAAINLNNKWMSNQAWFGNYIGGYLKAKLGGANDEQAHAIVRQTLDKQMLQPGTSKFQKALQEISKTPDFSKGAKFQDNTGLYHVDANLNLRDYIDWAEIQVGGSFREYQLNSGGTIFTDYDEKIFIDEYGVYTQIQKKILDDKLKLTGSVRYDKSKNFEGNFSPRISLAYAAGESKNHNFRLSYQTGFRNPTTQDQYIGLDAGAGYLLGTAEDNLDRYKVTTTINGKNYTISGRDAYERAFSVKSVQLGNFKKGDFELVKPERVASYEVGYRGAIMIKDNNRLGVDLSAYYNDYSDFIAIKNVLVPVYGDFDNEGKPSGEALLAIKKGHYIPFALRTNSAVDISSYGIGAAVNTKIFNGFNVGLSYVWSKFNFDEKSDPDFEPGFNTPEHKIKFQFGHPSIFTNFGFNVNIRWQNEFYWQSSFIEGVVDERTTIDAQLNYKLPKLKSVFKLGGSNLTGKEYYSAPGVGAVGSQYYISWTINN